MLRLWEKGDETEEVVERGGRSVGGGRNDTGGEEITAIRPSVGIWKRSNFDDG